MLQNYYMRRSTLPSSLADVPAAVPRITLGSGSVHASQAPGHPVSAVPWLPLIACCGAPNGGPKVLGSDAPMCTLLPRSRPLPAAALSEMFLPAMYAWQALSLNHHPALLVRSFAHSRLRLLSTADMANYARSFALFLAVATCACASIPSPAAAAADRLLDFDDGHANLYDGLEALDVLPLAPATVDEPDDLPAPEPADYELVSEDEEARIFVRSVDGTEAHKSWHAVRSHKHKRDWGKAWNGYSTIARAGWSGVSAMQCTLVDDDHIVIYDKAQNNALKGKNGKPAWGAVYRISTEAYRPLNLETNSFCAGGGWIGNGTLVSVGGNPPQGYMNDGAKDGIAAVRFYTPCSNENCDVYEDRSRIRLTR